MTYYKKIPTVIEAEPWVDWDAIEEGGVIGRGIGCGDVEVLDKTYLVVHSPEGDFLAIPGDFVVRDDKDGFRLCNPEVFNKTYMPVEKAEEMADDNPEDADMLLARLLTCLTKSGERTMGLEICVNKLIEARMWLGLSQLDVWKGQNA